MRLTKYEHNGYQAHIRAFLTIGENIQLLRMRRQTRGIMSGVYFSVYYFHAIIVSRNISPGDRTKWVQAWSRERKR